MGFNEILEREYNKLDESTKHVLQFLKDSSTPEEFEALVDKIFDGHDKDIYESMVKRVSSDGSIRKTRSTTTRKRRATMTTGMSRAELRLRGKKAARTRKRNPSGVRRAIRKRRRAMRKRKQYGL